MSLIPCPDCGREVAEIAPACPHCGRPTPGRPLDPAAAPAAGGQTVPNYLVQSILVTLCCCLPFGIVAIVYAAQVNGKLAAGDVAGAQAASRSARTWCWVAFGVGLVVVALNMVFGLFGVLAEMAGAGQ